MVLWRDGSIKSEILCSKIYIIKDGNIRRRNTVRKNSAETFELRAKVVVEKTCSTFEDSQFFGVFVSCDGELFSWYGN